MENQIDEETYLIEEYLYEQMEDEMKGGDDMDKKTEVMMEDVIETTVTEIEALEQLNSVLTISKCDSHFKIRLSSQIADELFALNQIKEQYFYDIDMINARENPEIVAQ